ncbi:MAG: VIT domain-containing protein [Pseudomonadales bacterium]
MLDLRAVSRLYPRRPFITLLTVLIALAAGLLSHRLHADLPNTVLSPIDNSQDEISGYLEAMVNEERVLLPALKVDYQVAVHGDLAQVKVVQTFANPLRVAITPRYLFPLHEDAAVSSLLMHVGDEVVVGEFQRRKRAQQTFAAAQAAGKVAAIVNQQRPNMFTQRIANLMPSAQVRVELGYTQRLRKQDGEYELVLPLVVGPRFNPPGARGLNKAVPYAPVAGLTLPETLTEERVGLAVVLEAPVPVLAVSSRSHGLSVTRKSPQRLAVGFAEDRVVDNRDFVLRYRLGGDSVSAGVLSHWQSPQSDVESDRQGGGYFSLLIEPPADLRSEQVLPREMVFLLDCSGSMSGLPMAASKAFMRKALEGLGSKDRFRIIRFSDSATEFADSPLAATPANIAAGLAYTDQLRGGGGTVMTSGIYKALSAPAQAGVVRSVVFLTDGYIGNEVEVLRLVRNELGAARLYALGVGTGVNRYLLEALAKVGRGFVRYMDPTEDLDEVAQTLAMRLAQPVLTDLQIDWGDLPVTDLTPVQLPDLFAGESLQVQGRFTSPAQGQVLLSGLASAGRVSKPLWVELSERAQRPPVRSVWARAQVAEHMQQLLAPQAVRFEQRSDADVQELVTRLGEDYGLMTRWTSLVAVSSKVYQNDPSRTQAAPVALSKVAGVTGAAYGETQAQNWPAFSGAGTPEPSIWAALLGLVGLAWLSRQKSFWRRVGS